MVLMQIKVIQYWVFYSFYVTGINRIAQCNEGGQETLHHSTINIFFPSAFLMPSFFQSHRLLPVTEIGLG